MANKLALKKQEIQGEAELLISQAIDKNVPVDTLERLLAMRRELKSERAKEEFDRAMASFQADCPTIVKTKEVKTRNGVVAYRYAPIESIVEQVKNALKEHGFSYSTNMVLLDNGVKVSVKVTHSMGHSEVTDMTVPLGNKTEIMSQSQVVAAAQTFAKRYAFCNAFGILTGDEDTDAAPIAPPTVQPQPTNTAVGVVRKEMYLTDKQKGMIRGQLTRTGKSMDWLVAGLKAKFNIDDYHNLTMQQASTVIDGLLKMDSVTQEALPIGATKPDEFDLDEIDAGIEKQRLERK